MSNEKEIKEINIKLDKVLKILEQRDNEENNGELDIFNMQEIELTPERKIKAIMKLKTVIGVHTKFNMELIALLIKKGSALSKVQADYVNDAHDFYFGESPQS